jgi:flagellar assembly protein FliH
MILRSRSSTAQVHTIEYPAVRETLSSWERRMAQAETAGRAAAQSEAQSTIAAAEQRAAAAERRAGEAEATIRAQYEERLGVALSALERATAELIGLHRQLVQEAETDIVRLALRIASRLLRREVEDDPTWMEPVLAEALGKVPDKRGIAVRMHPSDAEVATERKRLIMEQVPGLERVEFFGDEALPRGACVIASQGTRLDASLGSTWERLSAELLAEPSPALSIAVEPTADRQPPTANP